MEKARDIIRASGTVDAAMTVAAAYADAAGAALAPLGEHPVAQALAGAGHRLLRS
jgi:geranylgeranyl pyrophosphate synthase